MPRYEPQYAEFKVPIAEAGGLGRGQWIWELGSWKGVKSASLDGMFGYLNVEATKTAMKKVRSFCREMGFPEVGHET